MLLALRLHPGDDLREALIAALTSRGHAAAFVLSGIGSLAPAQLRLAGAAEAITITGDTEILTLSGTLGSGGAHLHASLSDARGQLLGGHVLNGCRIRTTAEVLLAVLPGQRFERRIDPATGYAELDILKDDPTP
ncbi:PPC domain-containing DNA-binding protein [Variovorax sp. YR752]|uniref:PPC domain-containing DNA-binding protein n=1 Tax=Variovorax sp. YR752 TaxID=1884383 RepID=UPI003137C8B1